MGKEQKKPKSILEELKGDYDNRLVSALVGAGFSKNVSDSFLGWGELLHDMVGELYEIDIKRGYDNYLHQNIGSFDDLIGEKEYKNRYIKGVLETENCLEIVSNYIKKKGYRESVEIYIEDRIPYAEFDGNDIVLKKQGEIIEKLTGDKFSAHKELLLAQKFQNIYTTNYENLLEFTMQLLPSGIQDSLNTVVSGKKLSDKIRSRNIIKIHGDLKTESSKREGFDGDRRLCYIIAKEDYDSFREKHEAFTSLMRIAMLQGKFMLLGFSGTDPNYQGWVTWMSDVIEGEDNTITKVYLVDVSGKSVPLDLQLHYENHHTKVVNLIQDELLKTIGFDEKERISILQKVENKEKLDNDIKRWVLTRFLGYLRADSAGSKDYSMTGGHDSPPTNCLKDDKDTSNSSTSEDLSIVKTDAYEYRKIWKEVSSKVSNGEELDDIVQRIKEAKRKNRFPKMVHNQESVILEMARKANLINNEAFLFALAVDEYGVNPYYYSKVFTDCEELEQQPLWNLLKIKESTFNGDDSILPNDTDACVYENIQRRLFHLDFDKANKLIENWNPDNNFIIQKAMRLAAINEHREEAKELLFNYIPIETNPIAKLYAMQVANYISGQFPRLYKYDEYYRYGIDGIGDNLSYMVQQLRGEIEKPKHRGWIGSTTNLGGENYKYEKSLRILRYISDVGVYTCFRFTSFLDIASWYLVFQNLYKEFPYPCFFYSIQYSDNAVLTRIGQDFAYTPELIDFNKVILIQALSAVGKDSMPSELHSGLLYVTGPIYMAIDETDWFELFKKSLFDKLIKYFDKADISDPLVKNVGNALVSLKNPENIKLILSELLAHYAENHKLADILVREYLHVTYIKNNIPQEAIDTLKCLISDYPNIDITELMYVFDKEEALTKEIKDLFVAKVFESDLEKLPQELSISLYLCLLTRDYPEIMKKAKKILLKHNIWHCGVMENGKGWSAPNYLRLNVLKKEEIEWTDEEFEYICENLKNNINKFDAINDKLSKSPFVRNIQTQYLSDILQFIDGLDKKRKNELLRVREMVVTLLQNRITYKTLIEGMLSEQPYDVDSAMEDVMHGIEAQGISAYLDEFNFILDKTIMGEGTTINTALRKICYIVENHPKEIVKLQLCSKLHTLLSIYKDRWTQLREFKPVWSFNYLYKIAKFIKENGQYDSEIVNYWLSDSFVLLFIRP